MAYGDVGGTLTDLIITCRALIENTYPIDAGDAVRIVGDYTVVSRFSDGDEIFGQALADAFETGDAIPVRVRGICVFNYHGTATPRPGQCVAGDFGHVVATRRPGPAVLKVDEAAKQVHVLL